MQAQTVKAILAAILLALGFASASAGDLATVGDPATLGFSAARLQRITSWYQAQVDGGQLPGAVVAIARNGGLAYLQAIGFQDQAKTVPMKADAIFWIASMTKPVTSVAAMMLVEEGKIELDAPVAQYLPQLKDMQVGVVQTDASGRKQIALQPPKRPMTVRDLLRHTSGLVYPPQFNDLAVNRLYNLANFSRDGTLADFVASLAPLPLAHQPGEVWEYSWGVDVLARVVEVASGQRFDEFLQSHIFAPLHMADTGFYVPQDKLARLVEAPEPRSPQFDVTRPRNLLSGGGGLVSTAGDYLRFCQMLLNGGELDGARLLKPETVRMMTTDSLPPGIRFVHLIGPKQGSSWGLGFSIRTSADASSIPGSVGSYSWNGLWGTYFWVDPSESMVVLQMIQVPASKVGPSFAAIRNLSYGALRVEASFVPPPLPPVMTAEALAGYAGHYHFGPSASSRDKNRAPITIPGVELEVRVDGGKLAAEATGRWPVLDFEQGKPLVLAPASRDAFHVDGEDHTRLAFVRDTQGRVSGAVLNPGPWQLNGVRIPPQ